MPTSESEPTSGTAGSAGSHPGVVNSPGPQPRRRRHWQKIGVELEGGWSGDYRRFLLASPLVDTKEDGSVNVEADSVGEITLGPYDRLGRALAMVTRCYPEKVDETCGLHVHLSFDRPTVHRLTAPAFFTHFADFWKAWGTRHQIHRSSEFWSRLAGECEYCEPMEFQSENAYYGHTTPFQSDRYSQVNFQAYREHGTLECRLLPAFKYSRVAIKAIAGVIDCFEEYLANPSVEGSRAPSAAFSEVPTPGRSNDRTARLARTKRQRYSRETRRTFTIPGGWEWDDRAHRYRPPSNSW